MQTVTVFSGSVAGSEQVRSVLAAYVGLERARALRRLLVARSTPLAVCTLVAGTVLHGLPPLAYRLSTALFLALPVCAWIVELRRTSRLERRLAMLPGASTFVIPNGKLGTKRSAPKKS